MARAAVTQELFDAIAHGGPMLSMRPRVRVAITKLFFKVDERAVREKWGTT